MSGIKGDITTDVRENEKSVLLTTSAERSSILDTTENLLKNITYQNLLMK